jgi:iron(III) transport system ATP-binding protein
MTVSTQAKAAPVVFEQVTKRYEDVIAVREVSFKIEAGKLVTLLGPSGCGKTTTLRLIAGLERVSEGTILIGSEDVTRLPATDRDVTMVFQSYALFPHMTVAENVGYGLKVSNLPATQVREQAEEGLRLVGLSGYGDRLPSELSGGQQQRVAVARALVLEPEVLLFDEPLSNLDAKLRRQVRQEIRDLQQSLGVTSVYVTHDQQEALAVSDRIIVMNQAVIAQDGSPREIYEYPADKFVANFIGDANLVDAEVRSVDGDIARVKLGPLELRLPRRDNVEGAAQVAIRPEAISIHGSDSQLPGLHGAIDKAVYLGSHIEYTISTEIGELFVVEQDVSRLAMAGSSVVLSFAEHGVTLIKA